MNTIYCLVTYYLLGVVLQEETYDLFIILKILTFFTHILVPMMAR